jgi:dTDP-4-dehydrorhamnose reductase
MKLWIPGANGLLGRALFERAGPECVATGRQEVDIGDFDAVRRYVGKEKATHIVNCAAFSQVDLAESRREEALRANAVGPENLGRVAKEAGARLIHISTDYVFPGDLHRPLKETDRIAPCNYYGQTKAEGEERLLSAMPSACVIRTSWIFGAGGKSFVAKLLDLLQQPGEIRLTDDHWGRPTYAPDLAEAILKMLDSSGIYHFANAGVATKYEFGLAMREKAVEIGMPVRTKRISAVPGSTFPSPCKRPVYSAFDTSKIEQELGEIRSWKQALKEHLCALSPISL